MAELKPEATRQPREIFDESARMLVWSLKAAGGTPKAAIVLVQDENGQIGISTHGINHAEGVNILASGTHLVLMDHDRQVLEGAAGHEAQRAAEELKAMNGEGIQ